MNSVPAPIVIGVTGHRDLRESNLPQLRETVRAELRKLQETCPHSPFAMLNSLAAGADALCAQVALELGMRLVCPLPMETEEYRRDFSDADLETFETLLTQADEAFVIPAFEPEQAGRDFRCRQAGIYVATHCHALLALWNGLPAEAGGCGTAEAVSFTLDGSYAGALLFAAAARRLENAPDTYESAFSDLAREEIIENGNWMSYCKENRPTFSL